MTLKLITAPTVEPVTLAEAKVHLKEDLSDNDALISALIASARQTAEHELGRALVTQTWERVLDAFPQDGSTTGTDAIELGRPPVISVVSVKYLDTAGIEQTLASNLYALDADRMPGWLLSAQGTTWPSTLDTVNAVRVRFTCGFGAAGSDVPAAIRQWMLVQIGHWYANREASNLRELFPVPYVSGLLDPYRTHWV